MINRIIVYTYIYEGAPKWAKTDAVVKIDVPGHEQLKIEMGKQNDNRTFCALAELNFNGDNVQVKKLVTFHNSHRDCDMTYGWGMRWQSGSK